MSIEKHRSMGKLHYSNEGDKYKLIVEVDPEITAFYRAMVPKSVNLKPQRWPPHITVVRNEIPPNLSEWGKHHGSHVVFKYNRVIQNDSVYYWLDVYSDVLTEVRLELGLPASSKWTRPPSDFDCFHSTIGNTRPHK